MLYARIYAFIILCLLTSCGEGSSDQNWVELTFAGRQADPDPFEAPDVGLMQPWPVEGRSLVARDLFTADGLVTAEQAMGGRFQPRPDRAAYTFDSPVDWSADPYKDRNWRFHLLALRILDPLIVGWESTSDERYLNRAVAIALDWVRAHPDAERDEDETWGDMVTGLRALRLSWINDRVTAGDLNLPKNQIDLLRASLEQHRHALKNPRFWRQHNHALYAMHGLMAVCRTQEAAEGCNRERGYAREGILRVLRGSYASDGGHKEHSPKYHDFVLTTLERLIALEWYDLSDADAAIMDAAREASGWMSDASGAYPNIGDSERDLNELADDAPGAMPGCDSGKLESCVALKYLPETGYAILKTASNVRSDMRASLFLTCAAHSTVHKHDDSLSFEWMDAGQHLLVDGGKLHYDFDDARRYLLSRAAHNTASLEGSDGNRLQYVGGCLEMAKLVDGVMVATGAAAIGDNATHLRRIRYSVGKSLLVTDEIQADQAFHLRWHLAPGLTVSRTDEGYSVSNSAEPILTANLPKACRWRAITGSVDKPGAGSVTSESYRELKAITTLEGRCLPRTGPVTSRFTLVR